MHALLRKPIATTRQAHWLGWCAGFGMLALCSTLVLKMLPEMGLAKSALLVTSVAAAWLVLARFFPSKPG